MYAVCSEHSLKCSTNADCYSFIILSLLKSDMFLLAKASRCSHQSLTSILCTLMSFVESMLSWLLVCYFIFKELLFLSMPSQIHQRYALNSKATEMTFGDSLDRSCPECAIGLNPKSKKAWMPLLKERLDLEISGQFQGHTQHLNKQTKAASDYTKRK